MRSAQEFAAKGMLKDKQQAMSPEYEEMMKMKTQVNWGIGDMDYEAWMRLLDSAVRTFDCYLSIHYSCLLIRIQTKRNVYQQTAQHES